MQSTHSWLRRSLAVAGAATLAWWIGWGTAPAQQASAEQGLQAQQEVQGQEQAQARGQPAAEEPNQAPARVRQRVRGRDLMTEEEREQQRAKMRALETEEEREAARRAHHEEMKKRAAEQGITLPDEPQGPPPGRGDGPRGPGGGR